MDVCNFLCVLSSSAFWIVLKLSASGQVGSGRNLSDMKTAISEPLLQDNEAAKCTVANYVQREPKVTQTASAQGQDFPFDPELCLSALHQSAPLLVSVHWISSQSPSTCTVAKYHVRKERDSFTALSNKHSRFMLGCVTASNKQILHFPWNSTNTACRVRNHVSARQQEPNLSNRLHNCTSRSMCKPRQSVWADTAPSHKRDARPCQSLCAPYRHGIVAGCLYEPLDLSTTPEIPLSSIPSTVIPPQQRCNFSSLFLCASSYPAIHVADTDMPCSARRSLR